MNAMSHDLENLIGVDQTGVEDEIRTLLPGYMAMGENGMHEMTEMNMEGPENTLPMMGGVGPCGSVGMGGMFTILKVREKLANYTDDPGWYENPKGTVAYRVDGPSEAGHTFIYVCPMHPEVRSDEPGDCPKCGMKLRREEQPTPPTEHKH